MEKLFDAASRGNVDELHLLLREDPLILHYVAVESCENPLDLARLCGHLDFAREMLSLKPEFSKKLNPKGYSSLHMAAANGHVEIVQELARFDRDLFRLKGRDMRTVLHCATLRGEIGVISEILFQFLTFKSYFSEYFKFQIGRDSPGDARNALLVIAVLVATAAYQVGLSPPGGTWQDNNVAIGKNNSDYYQMPIAGTSILLGLSS